MPAEATKGAEDGGGGLAFFFALAVLDGGGTAEAAVALDGDDRGVTVEVDPVAPSFGFMARLEVVFAEGGEDFDDGAWGGGVGELDDGFHVEGGRVGNWVILKRDQVKTGGIQTAGRGSFAKVASQSFA